MDIASTPWRQTVRISPTPDFSALGAEPATHWFVDVIALSCSTAHTPGQVKKKAGLPWLGLAG
ncbi:MAG TPA: hypothetical protein VJ734_05465 [Nitrosospira sp.]|nr:hypothetical protein [Nitrosospira sp.]